MRVPVVGAGPSGLVTLKYLVTAHQLLGTEPIEATLFQGGDQVGGTFVARVYEDAEASRSHAPYSLGPKTNYTVAGFFQATHCLLGLET